ncbi:MAG: MFS transporter [Acidobacteriota bacterium]
MHPQLSTFWFLYMAGLGIFFPFYSLHLSQGLGLTGTQVGLVMSCLPLVGLVAQPLWGQIADRTGSRRRVLALLVLGVACGNLWLGFLDTFAAVLLGTAALALFSTAALPMATAVTLAAQSKTGASAFGFVRMWGTLGFLAAVVAFPRLLEGLGDAAWGPWRGLGWMFPAVAVASLGAVGLALALPRSRALEIRSHPGDVGRLMRHRPVPLLLGFLFAAHLCLQGPINLFPLLITERGGDAASIGDMWVFMLLLEIPLIGFSGPVLRRLGPRGLLTLGLLAEGIRWSACAVVDDLAILRWLQLLHGVGVAGVIVGGPLYLELAVPERLRATGQTFVSTLGFGLGAIISISAGGWLFEHVGPAAPYSVCGAGALVLAALVFVVLPEPWRPDEEALDD